jgi:predicted methyltransferase
MRSPRTTACCACLLAFAAGCGASKPLYPQSLDLPIAPAQESRTASPTEEQPTTPEEPQAVEPAPAHAAAKPARVVHEAAPAPAPPPAAPPAAIAHVAEEPPESRPQAEALEVPEDVNAIVQMMDRYDSDRDLDASRHPGELLAFLGLSRGMKVGEIVAGGGYTTELLARRVGSSGKVWAENPPAMLKFFRRPFNERMDKGVMACVTPVDRPVDAPFPAEAKNLDAVVSVLVYHDTVWMQSDRDRMNKAVFEALKPGGEYVIVDHSAATGRGTSDAKTFHRIEEATVTKEVLRAGFRKGETASFLRNPADGRDWNDSPNAAGDKRGTSDRFVLKFVRP